MVLIDEYKDEGVAVFYHIGFESIYIITDQGTCDAIIPIFDNNIKKKNKDKKINSNRKQNVHEFYTYDGVHS